MAEELGHVAQLVRLQPVDQRVLRTATGERLRLSCQRLENTAHEGTSEVLRNNREIHATQLMGLWKVQPAGYHCMHKRLRPDHFM